MIAKEKGVVLGPEESQLVVWSSPADFVGRGQETIKGLLVKGPEALGEAKRHHKESAHRKQEKHTLTGAAGKEKRGRTIGVRQKPLKYTQTGQSRIKGVIREEEGNNGEDEGTMSCVVWNCRGMGSPSAVRALKDVLSQRPLVVGLIETKLRISQRGGLRVKLGYLNYFAVDRRGLSDGMALLWGEETTVLVRTFSRYHIDVMIEEPFKF